MRLPAPTRTSGPPPRLQAHTRAPGRPHAPMGEGRRLYARAGAHTRGKGGTGGIERSLPRIWPFRYEQQISAAPNTPIDAPRRRHARAGPPRDHPRGDATSVEVTAYRVLPSGGEPASAGGARSSRCCYGVTIQVHEASIGYQSRLRPANSREQDCPLEEGLRRSVTGAPTPPTGPVARRKSPAAGTTIT